MVDKITYQLYSGSNISMRGGGRFLSEKLLFLIETSHIYPLCDSFILRRNKITFVNHLIHIFL